MSLNFLLACWAHPGNLGPVLTAARRLRQRGHRVRVIGETCDLAEIRQAGFDAIGWRRPALLRPPAPSHEATVWAELVAIFEQVTFGGALDYAGDTLEALRSEPVDAVLSHDLLAGPVIAAEAMGVPHALLSPHVCIRPLDGVPICATGFIPTRDLESRVIELAARARLMELLHDQLPTLNRARAAFGLPPLDHILSHYDRVDRLLIGMSAAFDFAATKLPRNIRYVGPLLDQPGWARGWTAPWSADHARPRVLVSLSTSFQNQADLLRRILAALGSRDVEAAVTAGPAMAGENFTAPPNVTVLSSAPHDLVMQEVDVVVTHGGHGTVARALLHRVPLLVIPMGRDQPDNAARVVARGAGLALPDTVSRQALAAALERLIAEPHFRDAADRLGNAVAADVGSSLLVDEMETVAAQRLRQSA